MKVLVVIAALIAVALSAPKTTSHQRAEKCDPDACKLPNCRCMSIDVPGGLSASEVPQFVLLTFDDAITAENFKYYEESFFGKTNPDGCPISATYFMAHEYTDYSKVQALHAKGHEIALHSISHETQTSYWDNLSVAEHIEEFGGEREIVAHFANIPIEDVQGIRVPFLQLGGNNSFEAIKELGLTYDSSWPTQSFREPPLWPYSLDYKSDQDCPIGACPTVSIPGVWIQPMVSWDDNDGIICSMTDACVHVPSDVDGLLEFMIRNFNRHYKNNRAPFGFYVHAAWFKVNPNSYIAYGKFLDYLQSLNDVYIVNVKKAIEWTRNPTLLKDLSNLWPTCQPTYEPTCKPLTCQLDKNGELRYMTHCRSECPERYPWLGNPLGL